MVIATNIVSELMCPERRAAVLAWMDERPSQELFETAVMEAEVQTSIALLTEDRHPQGCRGLGVCFPRIVGRTSEDDRLLDFLPPFAAL